VDCSIIGIIPNLAPRDGFLSKFHGPFHGTCVIGESATCGHRGMRPIMSLGDFLLRPAAAGSRAVLHPSFSACNSLRHYTLSCFAAASTAGPLLQGVRIYAGDVLISSCHAKNNGKAGVGNFCEKNFVLLCAKIYVRQHHGSRAGCTCQPHKTSMQGRGGQASRNRCRTVRLKSMCTMIAGAVAL
jgi:hypothetical protein